ncbi:heterokaryon incompatibility, partial [Bimuria novae-zelandiae CBS 107.79]
PPYTAISYCWGDSRPTKQVICTNGNVLRFSATIASLIDALLRRDDACTLWIDALCINQNDPIEKGHQVALMGKVYSRASSVLVWLGDGDDSSQRL